MDFKWAAIIIGIIFVSMALAQIHEDTQRTERYKVCVEAMQKAIPDPNDDSRASFLKDCQQ